MNLTPRQRDCLDFIVQYQSEKRCSPSIQEISDGLGLHSKSQIVALLQRLEERGAITRLHARARSIQIIGPDITIANKLKPLAALGWTLEQAIDHFSYLGS